MSVCSYCCRTVMADQECFSWSEAGSFCKIKGADDPARLEAKKEHDERKAAHLRQRAAEVRASADRIASDLEKEAARLAPDVS